MLAGFTHRPVVELSERLAALAPPGSATRSTAPTARRPPRSRSRWRSTTGAIAAAPTRRASSSLAGGYHGETLGALAVTDVAIFRDAYAPLLQRNDRCRAPDPRRAAPGESPRERCRTRRRRARGAPGAAPRDNRRADRRAAGAGRDRHGDARPALPRAGARAHRALRRAADRRRDHDGIRPHRHAVRLGAGGGIAPGLPLPVEGHHRRLPAAVVRADDRRRLRRVLRRRPRARLPALALVHRQRARLPRGARGARHLSRRRRDRRQRRDGTCAGTALAAPLAAHPRVRALPATRHDLSRSTS